MEKISKEFAKAILSAQKEMDAAKKTANNPFLKSSYANINDVRDATVPVMNKFGIAVLQPITLVEGFSFVETTLIFESGEIYGNSMTPVINPQANNAQTQGAGITYARRYGLQSFLNIGTEDDDDGESVKSGVSPTQKVKPENEVVKEETAEQKYLKLIIACKTKDELTELKNGGIPKEGWTKKLGVAAIHQAGVIDAASSKEFADNKDKEKAEKVIENELTKLTVEVVNKTLPAGVQESHATLIGHGVITTPVEEVEDELAGL